MQEVDFLDFFGSVLRENGYDWRLKKKSENGHGLAILFKSQKLELTNYTEISFDEINNFNSCRVLLETGNIAQIISLRVISTDRQLIVSNTHLYWRPEASAIKIKQACMLLESLYTLNSNDNLPIIMCGGTG